MQIYAVYLPAAHAPSIAAEKARFVRQGFSWPAFLLTPFWALRHGLWLALALWLAWGAVAAIVAAAAHLDLLPALAVYDLGALFFGLEADRFRQARLSRAGFLLNGLAVGESLRDAETFYFSRREDLNRPALVRTPARRAESGVATRDEGNDLLGLFSSRETRH